MFYLIIISEQNNSHLHIDKKKYTIKICIHRPNLHDCSFLSHSSSTSSGILHMLFNLSGFLQFKTRRLLKDNDHIEFFYENKLEIFD